MTDQKNQAKNNTNYAASVCRHQVNAFKHGRNPVTGFLRSMLYYSGLRSNYNSECLVAQQIYKNIGTTSFIKKSFALVILCYPDLPAFKGTHHFYFTEWYLLSAALRYKAYQYHRGYAVSIRSHKQLVSCTMQVLALILLTQSGWENPLYFCTLFR
jgi:hypothetical protein